MKPSIKHLPFEMLPKIPRGLGIINHLITSKEIGAKSIHSGITLMPAGTSVPAHTHNSEEQVTVLEGTLKIILNGEKEVFCSKYDSTFLSPGVQHELINDSDSDVYAMVTYGSANVNRTFVDTGETVDIGSDKDRFSM